MFRDLRLPYRGSVTLALLVVVGCFSEAPKAEAAYEYYAYAYSGVALDYALYAQFYEGVHSYYYDAEDIAYYGNIYTILAYERGADSNFYYGYANHYYAYQIYSLLYSYYGGYYTYAAMYFNYYAGIYGYYAYST